MSQIRGITRELERLVERLVVKISLDTQSNLKETTPVLTGWARANWVPAIGEPGPSRNIDEPTTQDAASAAGTQEAAESALVSSYRLGAGNKVFVSNGVNYITQLNDGSSQKAPAGFVQQAIRKALTRDIRGFTG